MQNKFALALCLAAALASVAGCSKSGDNSNAGSNVNNVTLTSEQLKNVHLVTVEPSSFHKTIDTNGIVDFDNDQSTSVLAPFSGPVEKLLVSPGQHVAKGQPLAIISSPDFAADVGTYRKALVAARTARRVADFDKDLLAHQGVSEREEEQAQTDATSAEADAASARQALVGIDIDPRTMRNIEQGRSIARIDGPIRSPISGIVVEKLITPGELLQAGTTATFTVADLSRVWVMAQLFGSDPAAISVGDTAKIDTGAGNPPISGRVENIASEVDPNTLAVAVRVAVDNPGDRLKKQMYVRVAIEDHRQSTGLLVPVSSVLQDDENLPFVYVAQPDGSFARAHVTLGYRAGDRYAIADGIHAGERVVADGALFLQFMQEQ